MIRTGAAHHKTILELKQCVFCIQQVEASSLEPVDLEPPTTLQVFSLSEEEHQHLLPPLPTQPSHPRLEQLELDSPLHNRPLLVLGMLYFLKRSTLHTATVQMFSARCDCNDVTLFSSSSTKSFSASPAGQQAIAGRKFKMAVRRRK